MISQALTNVGTVAGGRDFGQHPHDNMASISIPRVGDLEHQDATGRQAVIRAGDERRHRPGLPREKSQSRQEVKFLQTRVFPNQRGVGLDYALKRAGNGTYAFVLEGEVTINGQARHRRAGFGLWIC
ncbi:pirin family protein [Hymenobacter sp.]|uniref:pirin family protein n=1 Tax=Hymenobacter sp. TaxID=1898978 RepID=UPI00286B4F96|nr:pirin family protein [Hymenobacter sp.]